MTVAVSFDQGIPCVELPDHHGEVFSYSVRAQAATSAGWRCWAVERIGDEEHSYTVRSDGRQWRCDCPAFTFSRNRLVNGCKHTRCVREVIEFVKALTGETT